MSKNATALAQRLVDIGAVSFSPSEPYTWASGLLSPMYCDNRQTLAYPEIRTLIAQSFVDLFRERDLNPEAIIGVATGAIAHGVLVAERLRQPYGYVRTQAKQHGKQNQIEGFSRPGERVVVIEDLISTGGSSLAAAKAVIDAGMNVEAVTAIFSYGFPMASEAFVDAHIPLHAIVHLDDLMAAAERAGSLDPSHRPVLREWMSDPGEWSRRRKELQ